MPLDSQIPLMGYQVPKIDYQARQEGDLRLKQLMMQDKLMQQQMADDQAQRQAFSQSGGDQDSYIKALAQGQNPKAYSEALKVQADRKKAGFDTDKAQIESALKKLEIGGQLMSGVRDQASYTQARQQAQAMGLDVSSMPDVYDPMIIQQNRQKAISVKDQLTQALQQQQFNETARHNTTTEGLTARGQNMVDARARENTAAVAGKPFEVTGPDGTPMLVQQDKQGNMKPVQGYGPKFKEEKPLTDSQSKALLFGSRMRESDKVLGDLAKDGTNSSIPGSRSPVIGGVINAFSGENQQALDQAKRDFMTAVLRRESGASISPSEFSVADKQYFPQIGDSEKVLKQKALNRKLAIDGVLIEVPEKHRASLQPRTEQASQPNSPSRQIVRTGTQNGRKVVQYSDGSIEYAD